MIVEEFDMKFRDFFSQNKSALDRWPKLSALFTTDYKSARVLFMTEVLALIDKWKEPSDEELNRILFHVLDGGHVAFPSRSIWDVLLSVWPLEVAKYNASMLRTFAADPRFKRYPMTLVTLSSTALVQAWWALETLMNDFGAIICKERDTISSTDRILLEERTIALTDKGQAADRQNYQPIDARIQFIYRLLTGEQIDRDLKNWMHLMELKNSRDGFVHRLGKAKSSPMSSFINPDTALKGLKAAQSVIGDVLAKTPEFAGRWTYVFLRYWSCCTDSPWIWDGCQGDVLHLGLGKVDFETVMALHAPLPAQYGEGDEGLQKQLGLNLDAPNCAER